MLSSVRMIVAATLFFSVTACDAGEKSAPLILTANGLGTAGDLGTANGLGGIGGTTGYSIAALSAAMPGYQVTAENYYVEGDAYPMLVVRQGEKRIAEILPRYGDAAHVGSIIVRDQDISLEDRVRIGDSYATVDPAPVDCTAGLEENSGLALCRDGKISHIGLNFAGDWAGPDGELPPKNILATFNVKEIIWSAGVL